MSIAGPVLTTVGLLISFTSLLVALEKARPGQGGSLLSLITLIVGLALIFVGDAIR